VQPEVSTKVTGSVVGTFRGAVDAERALDALREIGIPTDRVSMVMGEANVSKAGNKDETSEKRGTNVAGGAATGAALGAVVGILWGWIAGSGVLDIPGAVGEVSAGILSATITGLAIGAAVGALIGALIGVGIPEVEAPESPAESGILVTVLASGAEAAKARETLQAHGALDVHSLGSAAEALDETETVAAALEELPIEERIVQSDDIVEADEEIAQEAVAMSMQNDGEVGRDPNSITGTKDDIDPETGALGTAGTPMTTGYGVSGSTVGTGTSEGRLEQESEDFRGAEPDTKSYEGGGRGSTDSPDRGMEHDTPVEEKYLDSHVDEAPVPSEPTTRDIYEAGPSYGEPARAETGQSAATDEYESSDVHSPPSYGSVDVEASNESPVTDIPSSSDIRGRGDNTDKPN